MKFESEDFSMAGIDQYVAFAKRHDPMFRLVTEKLGIPENFNEDKNLWISAELLTSFIEEMYALIHQRRDVFGDELAELYSTREKLVFKVIRDSYAKRAFECFGFAAALMIDPLVIWNRLSKMVTSVNRYNSIHFELVESSFALHRGRVIARYSKTGPMNDVLSEMSIGSIYGLAEAIGYPVVSFERIKSITLGDDHCVFEFSWIRYDHYKSTFVGLTMWVLLTVVLVLIPEVNLIDRIIYPLLSSLLVVAMMKNWFHHSKTEEAFNIHNRTLEELKEKSKSFRILDTQLGKTKSDLESSVQLAVAGELSYGYLHDMESAISVIVMSTEILNEYVNQDHSRTIDGSKYLKMVDSATEQLVRMQNLIRKVTVGGGVGPLVPGSINAAVKSAVELIEPIAMKSKIEIFVEISNTAESQILAAEGVVESIILNLLNNSVRALAQIKMAQISVESKIVDGSVELVISDNGSGIPKEILENLNHPFSRSNGRERVGIVSSGFGLYKIRQSILRLDGKFDIESSVSGSRFTLNLKRCAKELQRAA